MIQFSFSLHTLEQSESSLSGFELGDIAVGDVTGMVSSANRSPSQSPMIFLAIVSLLDEVRQFMLKDGKAFTFVSSDSSFSIRFSCDLDCVLVSVHEELDIVTTMHGLAQSIHSAASEFYHFHRHNFLVTSPVNEDLELALQDFTQLCEELKYLGVGLKKSAD